MSVLNFIVQERTSKVIDSDLIFHIKSWIFLHQPTIFPLALLCNGGKRLKQNGNSSCKKPNSHSFIN